MSSVVACLLFVIYLAAVHPDTSSKDLQFSFYVAVGIAFVFDIVRLLT